MILSISEHVYTMLSSCTELVEKVGDKIYPLGAKQEVPMPFVVYERDSVEVEYDKMFRRTAETQVSIYVAAATYTESLSIAEIIADALDKKEAEYEGFIVEDAHFLSASEDFVETAFVQKITFNFLITEIK